MRFTARRIIAIAVLALTTFGATHATHVSRQAGITYGSGASALVVRPNGTIYQG